VSVGCLCLFRLPWYVRGLDKTKFFLRFCCQIRSVLGNEWGQSVSNALTALQHIPAPCPNRERRDYGGSYMSLRRFVPWIMVLGIALAIEPTSARAVSADQSALIQMCNDWLNHGEVDRMALDTSNGYALVGCHGVHAGGEFVARKQGERWGYLFRGGGVATVDDLTRHGVPASISNYLVTSIKTSSPMPWPTATPCAWLQQMYPPTQEGFEKYHLSTNLQTEVLKWVAKMSAEDKRYAKWMVLKSPQYGDTLLVFSAKPGDESWGAVNTNMNIDQLTCEIVPMPGA